MEIYDIPIRTLEDARRYFRAMGCSGFHMCRECPERYEEFGKMEIPKAQQREWARESVAEGLVQLRSGALEHKELWAVHARLADIVRGWELKELLEEVCEVTWVIKPALSPRDCMLVAETILGRQELRYRPGYIFQSLDAGKKPLAAQFSALARALVEVPLKAGGMEEARCQQVLTNLVATERACGLRAG